MIDRNGIDPEDMPQDYLYTKKFELECFTARARKHSVCSSAAIPPPFPDQEDVEKRNYQGLLTNNVILLNAS